ncbi:transposase [Adhaeribacter radiodurans]|uniref:transposase n=1 Tax=Adhaeribacter radiodurans TaxID=2745197 RepID=UPI001FE66B5A|nr:transposase [Adhaeribacter radiodurans]
MPEYPSNQVKPEDSGCHCSIAVDTGQGVITHIQSDFADGRDSQYLPQLVMQLHDRLKVSPLFMHELLADSAYANGANYAFLEQRGITGWIPVFGMYKPKVAGFPYDKENGQYTCSMGKSLPFKGFDHTAEGRLIKNYWAAPKDCRACALKATCAPNTRCRKITRTAYDPEYLRAYARQQSLKGKSMKRLRQSTVEPVFGSLIHYYGLRRIGVRGKAGASKVMLLAATAFNLRKYLKFKPVAIISQAIALQKEPTDIFSNHFIAFTRLLFN